MPNDDSPPRCATCKWWEQVSGNVDKYPSSSMGECHRHAPIAVMIDVDDDEDEHCAGMFPQTFGDDYCGDHAPREKADSTAREKGAGEQ